MPEVNLLDAIKEVQGNVPLFTDKLLVSFHNMTTIELQRRGLLKE